MYTLNVSNVIYHKFSHGAAFYTFSGKNVNVDVVVVVALLFYVHGKHLRSCRDGQLT